MSHVLLDGKVTTMMKRVGALGAALLMVLALVACTAGDENPGTVDSNPGTVGSNPGTQSTGGEDAVPDDLPALISDIPAAVDVRTAPSSVIEDAASYYRLQTVQSAADSTCLEGNSVSDTAVLGGASFMDACQPVTGQLWKIVPADTDGFYQLQTLQSEGKNTCLEGTNVTADAELGGAAFLDDCSEATGQQWRFVLDEADGTYRMQTAFQQENNLCLEGNQIGTSALLGGAAFQDACLDVTGQRWILAAVSDTSTAIDRTLFDLNSHEGESVDTAKTYRLSSVLSEDRDECLEGNLVGIGAELDGASFLDSCADVSGQRWTVVETSQTGWYVLQTEQAAAELRCFDGNSLGATSVLDGAAFMNGCSGRDAQLWRFVPTGDGSFYLQTREGLEANRCLEGNQRAEGALLGGSAFLDSCQDVTGQHWKITKL